MSCQNLDSKTLNFRLIGAVAGPSRDNPSSTENTTRDDNSGNIDISTSSTNAPQATGSSASSTLEPLGISIAKPKYPQYAVLATRMSSFNSWPTDIGQRPEELAKAGFVYEGIIHKYKTKNKNAKHYGSTEALEGHFSYYLQLICYSLIVITYLLMLT